MEWYEWVFDGLGTTVIAAICSFISYKAAVKQIGKQSQVARDNAKQKQEMVIEGKENEQDVRNTINQTQKACNNAEQIQYGGFKNGK
jgi:hypothetical protein